jgi:hypothetical protein
VTGPVTVLVVEDAHSLRVVIRIALERAGGSLAVTGPE